MDGRVATGREIIVSSVLIFVRTSLIAITRSLVMIRPGLIAITRRLVAITQRLIASTQREIAYLIIGTARKLGATGHARRNRRLLAAGWTPQNLRHHPLQSPSERPVRYRW